MSEYDSYLYSKDSPDSLKRPRSERNRSRERNRSSERSNKERNRSRERSRNRSRSRDRSRSRSCDKSRRRKDYGSRRSRNYYDDESDGRIHEDYHSRSRDNYYDDSPPASRGYDSYRSNNGKGRWDESIPNNVILVRNLPMEATEQDMINEFAKSNINIREVRLMRSKETGQSLRYCFVEFHTIPEAQYWMELNQGEMMLNEKHTLNMYYSTTRRGNINSVTGVTDGNIDLMADWTCSKCGCKNFQRRTFCRRCSHAREEVSKMMMYANTTQSDGSDQVGCNPCNTLILRGLDGLTTEEGIQVAFTKLIAIPVTNCQVIRDKMTGVSNGFALVEFGSVKESKQVMQLLVNMDNQLEVDGKALIVDYAKNTFHTAITTLESSSQTPAQESTSYYQPISETKDFSANQAAAVALAAIMKTQNKKKATQQIIASATAAPGLLGPYPSSSTTTAITSGSSQYPKYPVPDTSKFTYDASSGYYFDSSTGFYYDSKSQYFYNTQLQHFMYWDGEKQTYIPMPSLTPTSSSTTTDTSSTTVGQQVVYSAPAVTVQNASEQKRSESPEKVKVAKRIAKDMEKWAKKLNSQKEAMKLEQKKYVEQNNQQATAPAANAGYSLLEKSSQGKNSLEILNEAYSCKSTIVDEPISKDTSSPLRDVPSDVPVQSAASSSYQSASNESMLTESELIDWDKLMCRLCKRVFNSKEILLKHQQFSDLHKNNLEEFQKSRADISEGQQYRDRARERREKFGGSDPPVNKRSRRSEPEPVYPVERPTQDGIKEDNIGNKLLQKMGWKDGQGLGKSNQGIVDPIEATIRQAQAGLGSRGSSYNVDPSGSYKDRARNTFRAYFNEIN